MQVSYAAEEGTNLEIYVSSVSSGGNDKTGDGTQEKPYATLSMAYSQISDGGTGTIYLLDDITQTTKNSEALQLNLDKRVTITTAPEVNTVTIKRGEPSGTNALDTHFDLTKGELTLKNIIIDSNYNNQKISGRIINVYAGSKLIIEEGVILGGSYSEFPGSVIHLKDPGSVVEMRGGEIRGNKRDLTGAAVAVDSGTKFYMSGGLITHNTGGGVQSRGTNGGEIYLSGEARITGNTDNSGKALNVNLESNKTLTLNGVYTGEAGITTQSMVPGTQFGQATEAGLGSIEHLIADSGAILASYDASQNLVWRAFKNDLNQPSTDGEVTGKKPTLSGVTEPNATVTIKIVSAADQSIVVSEEVTADVNGNWKLPVANALSVGAYTINVTANKNNTQSEPVSRKFAVSPDVYVSSGGSDTTNDGTRNHPYATLYKAYQEVNDGGTIYVLDNIDLSVKADNNGKMYYLHLKDNKHVTISTASGVDTAVIQRGSSKGAATGETGDIDTLMHLEQGQLTLKNIIIDAIYAKGEVGAFTGRIMNVYNDSKLIIEEGTILRNSTSTHGGSAIYIKSDLPSRAVVEMSGGIITGNTHASSGAVLIDYNSEFNMTGGIMAENSGGGVVIRDKGQFNMTGGEITGNSGGGVNVLTGSKFNLSGTAHITGNKVSGQQTERNVNLQGNTFLTLSDNFTGQAGITAENRMAAGGNFGQAATSGLTGLENLIADNNSNLYAAYGEGNALVWQLQVDPSTPLAAPSNVKVTGDQLTWDAVENAESYEVSITDSEGNIRPVTVPSGTTLDLSTLEPSLAPGEYTITVMAKSNDPAYADSQASAPVTYTVPTPATSLAAPSNVKVTEDQLTWDAVENAESYEVSITDSEGNIRPVTVPSGTELDLSTLEPSLAPGEYTITVTAKSNDPAYADSEASESVTYTVPTPSTPLAAPSNVKVTGDQLTWDAVENAESYEVSITDSEGNIRPVTVPSGTTLDLSTLEPSLAPGEYTITVMAKSNDPAYADSQASAPVTYTVPTPATSLAAPSNVKVTEDQLTWDAVENAESYEVSITDSEGNIRPVTVPSGTTLDLSTLEPSLAPGEYTITVMAKSNDPAYADSQASAPVTYTVPTPATSLAAPSNVKVTEDQLTWDAVENAESYEVSITDSEGNIRPVSVPSGTELDLSTLEPSLAPGEYTITVMAKSNDPAYADSQASAPVTYTVPTPATSLAAPSNVKVTEDQLTWDAVENAESYEVSITDSEGNIRPVSVPSGTELDLSTLEPSLAPGEYTITVTAKSNDPAYADSAASESVTYTVPNGTGEVNKTELKREVALSEGLTASEYTPASWANLERELAEANRVLEDKNATQADVDQALTKLQKALKELVVLNGDNSGNDNSGGGNTGGGSTGGGNSGTVNPTIPPTPPATDNTVKPENIVTTVNGSGVSFASGTVNGDQATVTIDKDKLVAAISEGKGQDLAVHSSKAGDMSVEGFTADTLKQLNDKGASLNVSNLLAIYPVPASNVNLSGVTGQLGNAALNDIAVRIDIKRSSEALISSAKNKAADAGYELLVDPVDLDLTFSHDGETVRSGQLDGYSVRYIALPEGIDPNRITTGVIINPDGSVYHVPTVVTEMNNRYFARINDLRSSGSYSVIWNPQDFADVQSHWGKEDVNNIAARLDLKGNGDNTFSPDRSVTRSEFAEIVVLGLGLMHSDAQTADFPDVLANVWYGNAVAIANEFDIVRGYDNGNFNGGQQITREQGFAMIARAYRLIQSEGLPGQEQIASTLEKYEDSASVAAWAKADVAQLIAAGIIQGNGPELLSPKAQMTRAEVTALMARMLKATNLIDK
ncbi:S-layer homology domain-containing protein [Paenibacillus sp. Z3-2]